MFVAGPLKKFSLAKHTAMIAVIDWNICLLRGNTWLQSAWENPTEIVKPPIPTVQSLLWI
jgi:hypothetical protein